MHNHVSKDYNCPICLTIRGIENENTMANQDDIVYRDELVLALVNSKFIEGNEGHVIVFPVKHFENLYDLPALYLHRVAEVSRKVALALKSIRKCDGVWIEQNNEPASGQHAFHYHMHIVPRFDGDDLRNKLAQAKIYVSTPDERKPFADALRKYFISIEK
jgi:histidine triad (HIT) family protein